MPPSPKAATAVDLSHASFADLLENLVMADRLAEQKIPLTVCMSSAKMGHFGLQVKRQFEPMLIGLV